MFDTIKLKTLDDQGKRSTAIDLLMQYWDEEFRAGRFEEFQSFANQIDFSDYSPSVICCVHTVGFWIREKFDYKGLSDKVKAAYREKGFTEERINGLVRGFDQRGI